MTTDLKITDILPQPMAATIQTAFQIMEWAEDEIESARLRHHETGKGPLWNSFLAVRHTDPHMAEEIIYRAHAREILDRVAAGQDVRPGTDAEMIAALRMASLTAPLSSAAATLYFRIAARSFPGLWAHAGNHTDLAAYESVHGGAADDHEAWLKNKLARDRS